MDEADNVLIDEQIPSVIPEVERLSNLVVSLQDQLGMGDRTLFQFRLALTEGLTNAILHGNGGDASKSVHVRVACQDDMVVTTIEDEGEGFDPDGLPDPLAPENIEKEGGRGVFLIRALAREVIFEQLESGMRMTFLMPMYDIDEPTG